MKLKPEDLDRISENTKAQMQLRNENSRVRITVHMGTCGIARGAREIVKAFLACKETAGAGDVAVTTSGCAGFCSQEPMATVQLVNESPVKYIKLTPEKVQSIFDKHVIGGKIVSEYALAAGNERVL